MVLDMAGDAHALCKDSFSAVFPLPALLRVNGDFVRSSESRLRLILSQVVFTVYLASRLLILIRRLVWNRGCCMDFVSD